MNFKKFKKIFVNLTVLILVMFSSSNNTFAQETSYNISSLSSTSAISNINNNDINQEESKFNSQSIMWLILSILFIALEITTFTLTSLWFAFGSIVAMASTSFVNSTFMQFVIFLVSSLAFIIALKPLTKKYIHTEKIPTNFDRLMDMVGVVTKDVDWNSGEVKVDGKTWSARNNNPDTLLREGTRVEILKIQGVKLIVSELEMQIKSVSDVKDTQKLIKK